MVRKINKVVVGNPTMDGDGVKLVRVLGRPDVRAFDPVLMLDAFDSKNPADYTRGFPMHPHRGIETITYLIKGEIEHQDSMGNIGTIGDGCCQWMTAGSGVMHQEMPKGVDHLLGVQLWLNLPAKDKMTTPQYRSLSADQVTKVKENGVSIGVISGEYQGHKGATQGDYVQMQYLDVAMEPGASWTLETDRDVNAFVYIIAGEGSFDESGRSVEAKRAVLFESGDQIQVIAGQEGLRFLLYAAKPLHESVVWGGPIVMNTQQELEKAFEELARNEFVKENSIGA